MKKNFFILTSILFFQLIISMAYAFDLDETVDDELRKNYANSKPISALEKNIQADDNGNEDLPELPKIIQQKPNLDKPAQKTSIPKQIITANSVIKYKKNTTFDVISESVISDKLPKGTKVKFITPKAVYKKKYSLPAQTIFWGEIIDSHPPQITCNGGLVSIKLYSMTVGNQTYLIDGFITRANDKIIFLNKIKGDRTYLKTMWQKGNWGRNIFNKMMTLTINLGGETSTLILSPFPFAYGTICLGLNTLTSPISAFFTKGGNVYIPAGENFRIKLENNVYEY